MDRGLTSSLLGLGQVNFGYLEAGAVIAMVPCVLLCIGLQRFCIRGLTSGVVKGLPRILAGQVLSGLPAARAGLHVPGIGPVCA